MQEKSNSQQQIIDIQDEENRTLKSYLDGHTALEANTKGLSSDKPRPSTVTARSSIVKNYLRRFFVERAMEAENQIPGLIDELVQE